MVMDVLFIALVCWVGILVMESSIKGKIRQLPQIIWNFIRRIRRSYGWLKTKSLFPILGWLLLFALLFFGFMYIHWQSQSTKCSQPIINYWSYVWQFLTNNSVLVSIIASFIGLYLVFVALRPRLSFSDKMVLSNNGLLRVCISNRMFFAKLTDIQIEMAFIRWDEKSKDERTCIIPMNRSDISVIYGLRKGSSKSNYIVHSDTGFVWNPKYDAIRCRVIATHGISNIKRVFEERYSSDKIIRGAFVKGQPIKEQYLYPMSNSNVWNDDIKERCEKLWGLSDNVRLAIMPIALSPDKIKNANEAIEKSLVCLQNEDLKRLFPCFAKNTDTIYVVTINLMALQIFYKNVANLNPHNKELRNQRIEIVNKYMTYLADDMNKDIQSFYEEQHNKTNRIW